jgi:hypothetical protein
MHDGTMAQGPLNPTVKFHRIVCYMQATGGAKRQADSVQIKNTEYGVINDRKDSIVALISLLPTNPLVTLVVLDLCWSVFTMVELNL